MFKCDFTSKNYNKMTTSKWFKLLDYPVVHHYLKLVGDDKELVKNNCVAINDYMVRRDEAEAAANALKQSANQARVDANIARNNGNIEEMRNKLRQAAEDDEAAREHEQMVPRYQAFIDEYIDENIKVISGKWQQISHLSVHDDIPVNYGLNDDLAVDNYIVVYYHDDDEVVYNLDEVVNDAYVALFSRATDLSVAALHIEELKQKIEDKKEILNQLIQIKPEYGNDDEIIELSNYITRLLKRYHHLIGLSGAYDYEVHYYNKAFDYELQNYKNLVVNGEVLNTDGFFANFADDYTLKEGDNDITLKSIHLLKPGYTDEHINKLIDSFKAVHAGYLARNQLKLRLLSCYDFKIILEYLGINGAVHNLTIESLINFLFDNLINLPINYDLKLAYDGLMINLLMNKLMVMSEDELINNNVNVLIYDIVVYYGFEVEINKRMLEGYFNDELLNNDVFVYNALVILFNYATGLRSTYHYRIINGLIDEALYNAHVDYNLIEELNNEEVNKAYNYLKQTYELLLNYHGLMGDKIILSKLLNDEAIITQINHLIINYILALNEGDMNVEIDEKMRYILNIYGYIDNKPHYDNIMEIKQHYKVSNHSEMNKIISLISYNLLVDGNITLQQDKKQIQEDNKEEYETDDKVADYNLIPFYNGEIIKAFNHKRALNHNIVEQLEEHHQREQELAQNNPLLAAF